MSYCLLLSEIISSMSVAGVGIVLAGLELAGQTASAFERRLISRGCTSVLSPTGFKPGYEANILFQYPFSRDPESHRPLLLSPSARYCTHILIILKPCIEMRQNFILFVALKHPSQALTCIVALAN